MKIIAEIGVNHNGSLSKALELVDIVKASGADVAKFQTFKASNVATNDAPKADYQLLVTAPEESQIEMLKKLELSREHYPLLIQRCKDLDIEFMSTPYDIDDAKFLVSLGVKTLKIASGQLVEYNFLENLSKIADELILSTGMGTLKEVKKAVQVIKQANENIKLVVLQCTTNYPSMIEDANIKAMLTMGSELDVSFGYSDHVPNNYAAYAAVALGAEVIEKHITYSNDADGPDHSSSLNPDDFKNFVHGCRAVKRSLGNGIKNPSDIEKRNMKGMRRSLVYKEDLAKGDTISLEHLVFKRPCTGLVSEHIQLVVGKTLKKDVHRDEQVKLSDT